MISIDYTIYRETDEGSDEVPVEIEATGTFCGDELEDFSVEPNIPLTDNEEMDIADALQEAWDGDYNDIRCDARRGG